MQCLCSSDQPPAVPPAVPPSIMVEMQPGICKMECLDTFFFGHPKLSKIYCQQQQLFQKSLSRRFMIVTSYIFRIYYQHYYDLILNHSCINFFFFYICLRIGLWIFSCLGMMQNFFQTHFFLVKRNLYIMAGQPHTPNVPPPLRNTGLIIRPYYIRETNGYWSHDHKGHRLFPRVGTLGGG